MYKYYLSSESNRLVTVVAPLEVSICASLHSQDAPQIPFSSAVIRREEEEPKFSTLLKTGHFTPAASSDLTKPCPQHFQALPTPQPK